MLTAFRKVQLSTGQKQGSQMAEVEAEVKEVALRELAMLWLVILQIGNTARFGLSHGRDLIF